MKKISQILLLGAVLILCQSCVKEVDFNQLDDLQVTPSYTASILYLETIETVMNAATDADFFSDTFEFEAFSGDFLTEKLVEGIFSYEIENTTSKPIQLSIDFLNDAGDVLDTETFRVDATPTPLLIREVVYGSATGKPIDILLNTTSLQISALNLGDNTSVSSEEDPKFIFRSSAAFTIKLKGE